MKINCYKYTWDSSTDLNEVNFFSDAERTLTSEVILSDYLIRNTLSNVEYNYRNVDETENTLYTEASNFNFQCINSINNGTELIDFFELYEKNAYVKYLIQLVDDNNFSVFIGVLTKDGISIDNRIDSVISFIATGYEKEFKEYFTNIPLESSDTMTEGGLPIDISLQGQKYYAVTEILRKNFPNVNFEFTGYAEHFLDNFFFAKKPYTYTPETDFLNEILHNTIGYESLTQDGVNKFTFLNALCLTMGWVWLFYQSVLIIKPVHAINFAVHTLDYNETFIKHSIQHDILQYSADVVTIDGGSYYANFDNLPIQRPLRIPTATFSSGVYYIGGEHKYYYSDISDVSNLIYPFSYINYNGGTQHYTLGYTLPFNMVRKNSDVTDKYNELNQSIYYSSLLEVSLSNYAYPNTKILNINTYIVSTKNGGRVDTHNARANTGRYYGNGNSYVYELENLDTEFSYTGNIGNALIYYNENDSLYYNYPDYMQLQTTKDNFKSYLRNANEIIFSLEVAELITNPLQVIEITNYPFADLNGKSFTIQSLSYNLETNTSNLTLQLI